MAIFKRQKFGRVLEQLDSSKASLPNEAIDIASIELKIELKIECLAPTAMIQTVTRQLSRHAALPLEAGIPLK